MTDTTTTVLVVDDEATIRTMLRRRLERRGYAVVTAAGGREAVELIRARPIDVVVLDARMPGMDGLEVLSLVRKSRPANVLPIVMATARAGRKDAVGALGAGANDFVTKPIDFEVLVARIEVQLRARTAPRAREKGEPSSAAEVVEGVVLDGTYRIGELLGSGRVSTVHRATDLRMGREVAIKVLKDSVARGPDLLERFRHEAMATCRVKHPNAITVFDFRATQAGVAYMVLELLHGASLDRLLTCEGRLSLSRCAEILIPVAGLLRELHAAGMVHCDLKPSNIFLESIAERETVKVLDFGIARLVDEEGNGRGALSVLDPVPGTPAYMAPERIRKEAYDPRSDIYSLGVCLYRMLEGRLPFQSASGDNRAVARMHMRDLPPPFQACRAEVGSGIEDLVMETLAKYPALRPTADEFARRLAETAARPDLAPPPPLRIEEREE